ncbi:MAG: tetratricopeptide repeat protein [Bacteroidetes bacterium]|nr:tetratricopeptide repeat protein [Bacteroidota bacterium]
MIKTDNRSVDCAGPNENLKTLFKIGIIIFGMMYSVGPSYAQGSLGDAPTDDLGDVSDAFQDHFFEALKQKGIENYELALNALKRAERAAKKNEDGLAVVYFETGKNLKQLKRYDEAEDSFKRVLASEGDQLDVMEALYDLYYLKRDYQSAIPLVKKLIVNDEDYKEDLANLYHRTKKYDAALALLDELDDSWGETAYRNALRRQIYKVTGNNTGAIENLETKIDKNSKREQDYLNLIFLYSEKGETEKAFATAKELLKNQPNSQMVHLALYKFYLDRGNTEDAMNSMKQVFSAAEIKKESKYKVLSDFIRFVEENPTYEKELENVVNQFSVEGNGAVYEQLGGYYSAKGDAVTALTFYEKGVALDDDNFSLLKKTLLLQIEIEKYEEAVALSEEGLGVFPAQPMLYLINGVANNRLGNISDAIDSLESGVDFLLDNPTMEKDFYEQLKLAYTQKGNTKKATEYGQKAAQINIAN